MPNGDRTGPAGAGSRTGRGMGYCVGNQAPGWQVGGGRGFRCGGRGRGGRGRGFIGNVAVQTALPPAGTASLRDELEALRMQVAALGRQLAGNKE